MTTDLDDRLSVASVIGAAGKMGSGITLLLAQEMARLSLQPESRGKTFRLNAVDLSPAGLAALREYVHVQAQKSAEKGAVGLRALYADRADLVENSEIIDDFVHRVESVVWPSTELSAVKGSRLVFEAIVEKIPVKVAVYKDLKGLCAPDAFFLTNTSSVPIGLLDGEAGLGGRILGYHFYNPPPVQKLVEIIRSAATRDDVAAVASELGKRLRKTLIPSRDVAGFIGNGHFIRDGLHGLGEAARLAKAHGWVKAVHMVNRVSQEWLVRPMGIFQLIDYVGIDVFKFIQDVMNEFLDEELTDPTIDAMVVRQVLGGQNPDGSQKPGFFGYEKGRIASAYDLDAGAYVAVDPQGWTAEADAHLGRLPEGYRGWKALSGAPDRDAAIQSHFAALEKMDTPGALIGKAYLRRSREIAGGLVDSGVAARPEDVNGVLTSGFYHLYGPINEFCP
ncbi:MAG: 3-hydroxyacyl-CoA dehydrogenase family protein [Acidobacteriia bacterium]|nr:3-hydroxyacyl-CoA dehydrogenase family protein [Terriglobia bacterium]